MTCQHLGLDPLELLFGHPLILEMSYLLLEGRLKNVNRLAFDRRSFKRKKVGKSSAEIKTCSRCRRELLTANQATG